MKNFLLKTWLTMICLLFGVGTMWAEDPTVTLTTSSETSTSSVVVSPVTFSFTNGSTNTSWYSDGLRFYEGATITVSSESNITKIVFTHGVSNSGCLNLTSGGGSYNSSTKTWTGSSKSIVFTVGHNSGTKNGQVKLTEAVVSYSSGGGSTPTLYTVTLGDNSTSLTQTTEGGNVTLPAREGNSTYTFAGWSITNNTEETTTAPTIISAGNYKPTANITLYPVYTRTDNGGSTDVSQTYETAVAPTGWTSNSITRTNGTGITSHGGSYWGSIAVNGTAYIQYNTALTGNVSVTAYVARTTSNTNKGEFKIQSKTSTGSWTDRATLDVANSTVDEWQELSWTGTLSEEQVRILYTGGTTAVRAIDDVCITYSTSTTYYISSIGEEKPTPELSFSPATYNYTMGETFNAPTLTNPENVPVTYTASDVTPANCIEVATDGTVTINATGSATITASFAGNEIYKAASASYQLVVAEKFSYSIETVGSGTTVFKDGSDNVVNPGDKVDSGTKIYPTFTPADGYEFTSWEYWGTSDDVQQWKPLNGDNFTITKDVQFRVTFTAVTPKEKYVVTIETPENGTLTIKDGETVINSSDEVEEGKTLTVEVAPADGYKFKNWGYKDGDANWVGNLTSTFTHVMPSAPCSFKANFELIPVYTINWSVNGTIVKTENLKEGAAVTAPAVEPIGGKVFTGWIETATVEGETPAYVTPAATATKTITYYAVFAEASGSGSEEKTHETTNANVKTAYPSTNAYATTYNTNGWTGKYAFTYVASGSYYAINIGYNEDETKGANNSHLTSPVFSEGATSITINMGSKNSNLATFYLCDNDEIGCVKDGDQVYGKGTLTNATGSITIPITGSPTQFHIYVDKTIHINSLSVTYGSATTYSDYTTTPAPYTRSITNALGTICLPYGVDMSEVNNVKFYTVACKKLDANDDPESVVFTEVEGNLEAGVPYVFKAETTPCTIELPYTGSAVTAPVDGENGLYGAFVKTPLANIHVDGAAEDFYLITNNTIKAATINGSSIGANRAYLRMAEVPEYGTVPVSSNRMLVVGKNGFNIEDNGTITLIDAIATDKVEGEIYNLQGQRINRLQQGVNIVNGRKVIR